VISLKTRVGATLAVTAAALLLSSLFVLSLWADRAGYDGLLLVTPISGAAGGITPETAERLRRDEGQFLTYEISSYATVRAINAAHTVTLVGTNSAYLDITGYRPVSGGFFTQSAWDGQNRLAVLNESAAYEMFGGTNIDGQTIIIGGEIWLVTGVVGDGQEDSRVFVPSSVGGGNARSLMVMMGNSAGRDYVVSVLAGFGIRDGDYDFLSLCAAAGTASERFSVAWKVAVCLAIILLGQLGVALAAKVYIAMKKDLSRYYFRELISHRKADVTKVGVIAALLLGAVVVILNLLLRILATVLRWRDIVLPVWYPNTDFAYMLEWLRDFHAVSVWVFGAYILAVLIVAAIYIGTIRRKNCGGNIA